jgi:hypothetical protein
MNAMKICRYDEVAGLPEKLRSQGRFVVEIDGKYIRRYENYIDAMVDAFAFPEMRGRSFDAFMDWMTDLGWLTNYSDNYIDLALFVYNYEAFMRDDLGAKVRILGAKVRIPKAYIIETFASSMLYFWHSEIERTVAGGKRCAFDIYLVSAKG